MTTITVYRSDDTSAPVLTGQVGSLTALLDAILVNGYGSKSAAGWAILYTATNKRVYQAPSGSGNRFPLQVDDANTLAAGANYARANAYESMTSVTAGTAPVPTAAQVSGGLYITKSTTADATARPWWCVATNNYFYLVCESGRTAILGTGVEYQDCMFAFGDFFSDKAAAGGTDAYNTFIIGNSTATTTGSVGGSKATGGSFAAQLGHYVVRPYTQLGSAAPCAKSAVCRSNTSSAANLGSDTNDPNLPDPVTGAVLLGDIELVETGGTPTLTRGRYPGWFDLKHNPSSLTTAFAHLDTCPGGGFFSGATFLLARVPNGPANTFGFAAFQIAGTVA